ncbi:MAG: hypothetical protein L3J74_12850 [Bacteroidales bacterium]|nr:hypothetical protein [Bacteroidales bacterium]
MNRVLLILFFLCSLNTFAQKKDIRLNAGFQFALPERLFNNELGNYNDKNMGGGFHLMPVWNYNKNWQFGLNFEFNLVTENFTTDAITAYEVFSILPTANYQFTYWKIKPYIGMGAGVFGILYTGGGLNFGIRPQIGLSFYDTCTLSAEYSKFFGSTSIPDESDFGNYYFALKASFSIGLVRSKYQKLNFDKL